VGKWKDKGALPWAYMGPLDRQDTGSSIQVSSTKSALVLSKMKEIMCSALQGAINTDQLNTNHVVVWMNVKQLPEILECNRSVRLEAEVGTVVSRCLLTTITVT